MAKRFEFTRRWAGQRGDRMVCFVKHWYPWLVHSLHRFHLIVPLKESCHVFHSVIKQTYSGIVLIIEYKGKNLSISRGNNFFSKDRRPRLLFSQQLFSSCHTNIEGNHVKNRNLNPSYSKKKVDYIREIEYICKYFNRFINISYGEGDWRTKMELKNLVLFIFKTFLQHF